MYTHTNRHKLSVRERKSETPTHTHAHMCVCELNRHLCNFSAAAWLHMLSVPFCAVPLFPFPFPRHLTASSCLRQRVFYIFLCAPRSQGYKNCLVLKAFYATLCAQSTAAATAAAASACLARCCYGAASLPLSLSVCSLLILPPYSVSALSLLRLCLPFPPPTLTSLSHLLTRTRFPHVICFVDVAASACVAVDVVFVALLFCLYFIIIIFRVILCFARQFLWKNSTFTFLFSFMCICLLPSAYVRTCVCVCLTLSIFYDYFSFLCVAFYIFFIAPFFVLFCLSRLPLVALSAAFSMPACGSPPSPIHLYFCFLCLSLFSLSIN